MNPNRHNVTAGYPPARGYGLDQPRLMAPYRAQGMAPYYAPQPGHGVSVSSGPQYRIETLQSAERRDAGGRMEYDEQAHSSRSSSPDQRRSDAHAGPSNGGRAALPSPSTAAALQRGKKRPAESVSAVLPSGRKSDGGQAYGTGNPMSREDGSTPGAAAASPGGGGGTENSKKRKKAVSCENCRRRKLKCDRGWPCGACRDREEAHLCSWEGGTRPQAAGRDHDNVALLLRMDKMEILLGQIASHVGVGGAQGGTRQASTSLQDTANISVAQSVDQDTGTSADNSGSSNTYEQSSRVILSTSSKAATEEEGAAELHAVLRIMPDTQTVRKLCQYYFDEVNWMHYAVEEDQFWLKLRDHEEFRLMNTMRQGRPDSKEALRDNLQFAACILGICALSLLFSDESQFPEVAKSVGVLPAYGPFFDGAQRAFHASSPWEEPTLLSFRILLLIMWGVASVRGPSFGNALLAQAVNQMYVLELDVEPPRSMPKAQARDRVRLFHSIAIMDWFGAGSIKRSYMIREEPVKHPYLFDRQTIKEGLSEKDGFLLPDMWLKLEVARINRRAADRAAMTEKDAYAATIQLQAEVDEIFSELPPDFEAEINVDRTEFDLSSFHRLAMLMVVANQLINLHKRYYIQGWLDPVYRTSRDICFSSARRICLVLRKVFNHVVPMDKLMAMNVEEIQKVMEGRQKLSARLWFFAHTSVGACLLLQHHYALMEVHPNAAGPNAETVRAEIVDDLRYTRRLLLAMSTRSQIARSGIAVLARPELACEGGASQFVQHDGKCYDNSDRDEDLSSRADLAKDLQSITDHDSFAAKRYRLHGNDSLMTFRSRRHRPSGSSDHATSHATPQSIGTPSSATSHSAHGYAHNGGFPPSFSDDGQRPTNQSPSSSFALPGAPSSQQHKRQPSYQQQQQQQQSYAQQTAQQAAQSGGMLGPNGFVNDLADMEAFLESALATDTSTGLPLAPEVSFQRQADRIGGTQPFVPSGMMGRPMSPFTSAFLGAWEQSNGASQADGAGGSVSHMPVVNGGTSQVWF